MPFMQAIWLINRPAVSSELLQGEVIAIHLETGIYYSLRGSAAEVWTGLTSGADAAVLARRLVVAFGITPEEASRDVRTFLQALLAEGLVVETLSEPSPAAPLPAAPSSAAYAPPALERFSDLQDLLLLDPIHDVGAHGWPQAMPDKSGA